MKISTHGKNMAALVLLPFVCAVLNAREINGGKLFGFGILESGSWTADGDFINRLDLRLYAPYGFSLRGQLADKRPVPPWENTGGGLTAPGAALYHKGTGSRLLYGLIETKGLLNRTRNIWIRSVPWFETHVISNADLKTQAGEMEKAAAYMQLLSPQLGPLSAYFSTQLERDESAAFTGGAALRLPSNSALRLEGVLTEKELEERGMAAWFSDKPYLPKRKFRFYAVSAAFTNKYLSFAGDFARSDIFAWGMDIYADAAVRAGAGPFSLSLAADGAGKRFSGADGSVPGAGFRSAAKFEWKGGRNMLFRTSSVLRAAAWKKPFDRSVTSVYFRFPLNKSAPLRINRISMSMERDAQNWEKIDESLTFGAAFSAGPFRPAFSLTVNQYTDAKIGDKINPYPDYSRDHKFESLKFSGQLSCTVFFVSLKGAVNYSVSGEDEPLVSSSVSASFSGKPGRITLKLSDNGKSGGLSYSISWRIQKTF
ncbi:MAG: hypothetical protein LBP37_03830 [Spirochaetaceae bacterium]|jgi:hypothetical protein|nr:hypothetical protein [Spirochaetaceae bacterium]